MTPRRGTKPPIQSEDDHRMGNKVDLGKNEVFLRLRNGSHFISSDFTLQELEETGSIFEDNNKMLNIANTFFAELKKGRVDTRDFTEDMQFMMTVVLFKNFVETGTMPDQWRMGSISRFMNEAKCDFVLIKKNKRALGSMSFTSVKGQWFISDIQFDEYSRVDRDKKFFPGVTPGGL